MSKIWSTLSCIPEYTFLKGVNMNRKFFIGVLALLAVVISLPAEGTWINRDDSPVDFFLETESGAIALLAHTYQVGENGTEFDFRKQGGQEILFPFQRFAAGVELFDRHRVTFTYQPLQIVTNVTFREEVKVDNAVFPAGTPMELSYGFPFYRLSYTYDLFADDPEFMLGVGAVVQLRNASIKFEALQDVPGTNDLAISQNLGPVPALAVYSRWETPSGLNLSADIAGIFASSRFINGANFEFEGSILDASLRAGYVLNNGSEVFANLRFFGGTAEGVSQYPDIFWTKSVEDFTSNKIASVTVSLGTTLR